MFKCQKCNELLGSEIRICPFCRTEVTDEYLAQVKAFEESEKKDMEERAMELHKQRTNLTIKGFILSFVIFVIQMILLLSVLLPILVKSTISDALLWIVIVLFMALPHIPLVILFLTKGVGRCPYCEKSIGEHRRTILFETIAMLNTSYCKHCGGRLR